MKASPAVDFVVNSNLSFDSNSAMTVKIKFHIFDSDQCIVEYDPGNKVDATSKWENSTQDSN